MIKCAAALSGNGVTMRLLMELLRMERLYMLIEGDHGEEIHDGNFCMDGLVYPDRTVHRTFGIQECLSPGKGCFL